MAKNNKKVRNNRINKIKLTQTIIIKQTGKINCKPNKNRIFKISNNNNKNNKIVIKIQQMAKIKLNFLKKCKIFKATLVARKSKRK